MTTSFSDWLPPLVIGLTFMPLACLKLYGLRRGIVDGKDKPLATKLCGT